MRTDIMQKNSYHRTGIVRLQRGLALFISLIALVAMSLAAAALIRSVDTGVLVAGNLAFKQSAMLSADSGISRAYREVSQSAVAALEIDRAAGGYYATLNDAAVNVFSNAVWNNAYEVPVDLLDKTGNNTKYIIQRMCRNTGKFESTHCLVAAGVGESKSSKGSKSEGGGPGGGAYGAPPDGIPPPIYRVTVRVKGPNNSATSYLQAFIY